jgi:hypothetical protein
MQKPTTELNFAIISHILQSNQVRSLLDARDHEPHTTGISLHCEFFERHPTDPHRSAYNVEFTYSVNSEQLERNDDVSVTIEVIEGNPVGFHILNIRTH